MNTRAATKIVAYRRISLFESILKFRKYIILNVPKDISLIKPIMENTPKIIEFPSSNCDNLLMLPPI